MLSLNSTSPSGRAVTLLSAIQGHNYSVQSGDAQELSLTTSSTTLSDLSSIVGELLKESELLGKTEQEKKEVKNWLARIEAGETEKDLKVLDQEISSKTYLVGTSLSAADISLFAALHPYMAKSDHSTLLSHPSLTRHFDHIQRSPLVISALAASPSFVPSSVPIDVDNVPTIVRIAEVKVKKVAKETSEPETVAPAAKAKKEPTAAAVDVPMSGGGEKKPKKEKKAIPPAAVEPAPAPWMIDLRVGTIIDVKLHPDADSLYVETIDIGEAEPRTVVSGLVKYIPIEQMKGRTLITVCNLKPANMRGVKSFAMVLCASSKEGKDGGIEFVDPPAGSKPGDRVYFEGFESETALELLNPKKKIFETVQPGFTTLDTKEAAWVGGEGEEKKVYRIITAKGVCSVPTFVGASLS